MAEDQRDPYKIECGKRLVKVRQALGYTQRRAFAKYTLNGETDDDVLRSEARLKGWENGDALVPPRYVDRLKQLFGVSHDYIYSGDPSGLRQDVAAKLIEQDFHPA